MDPAMIIFALIILAGSMLGAYHDVWMAPVAGAFAILTSETIRRTS